jgi:hypothetical protein
MVTGPFVAVSAKTFVRASENEPACASLVTMHGRTEAESLPRLFEMDAV